MIFASKLLIYYQRFCFFSCRDFGLFTKYSDVYRTVLQYSISFVKKPGNDTASNQQHQCIRIP